MTKRSNPITSILAHESIKPLIIAIDFDGTCVTHEYPLVGVDIGAAKVIRKLVKHGHKIILWTMRSGKRDDGTDPLQDAVNWFKKNRIPLFGINNNPTQSTWTKSPKAYANIYIDDAALGCPLYYNAIIGNRPFVAWDKVEEILKLQNIIK